MRSKRRRMFPPFRAAVAPGGILMALGMFAVVVPRVATVAAQSAQEGLAPKEKKRARPLVVGTGGKTFREGLIPSPIPPLPGKNAGTVDGVIINAPFWMADPRSVHEGVFSDGLDLSEPPQLGHADATCPGSDPSCGWVNVNSGVAHASSPDFGIVLQQAIDDAKGRELPQLDGGFLTEGFDILKTLASYGDDVTQIASPTTTKRFLGYTPEYSRWVQQTQNRLMFTYPDPLLMSNLRERGARLYCAARVAQNKQTSATKSMGKLTAFSFNLFGQNIDFLTVEPTLVLDGATLSRRSTPLSHRLDTGLLQGLAQRWGAGVYDTFPARHPDYTAQLAASPAGDSRSGGHSDGRERGANTDRNAIQ
jgi:hypothetical protein